MTDQNTAAQPVLTTEQILSLERRGNMTDDEALRYGRAIESALLSKLRAEGVQAGDEPPGGTRCPVLRAMARNYTAGKHTWDALDADACEQGAEEIRHLRAALASAPVAEDQASVRHASGRQFHVLKTDPDVFQAVLSGAKTFEIRLNDRGYAVGDALGLRETKHTGAEMRAGAPLEYTGRECLRFVSHVLTGYGLADGWCCLSFKLPHAGGASSPVAAETTLQAWAERFPEISDTGRLREAWNAARASAPVSGDGTGDCLPPAHSTLEREAPEIALVAGEADERAAFSARYEEVCGRPITIRRTAWYLWKAGIAYAARLASAPVDPEAEDADFLVRVLMQLDTWRVEDWNELIERRPAILALLRPLVMAGAPVAGEAQPVAYQVRHLPTSPEWFGCDRAAFDVVRESRPQDARALYAAPQASEAVRNALWTLTEHNALHFGEQHNTVIQGRAALKTQTDKDGGDCVKGAGDADGDYATMNTEWAFWLKRAALSAQPGAQKRTDGGGEA